MRYSEIIGAGCYGIRLMPDEYEMVDVYFSGAAHHYWRWKEVADRNSLLADFHLVRHRAHLRHLMELVYLSGDFSQVLDPTLCDMDERETWNPDNRCIPDSEMLDEMSADPRAPAGIEHNLDRYLQHLKGPVAAPEIDRRTDGKFYVRRLATA